MALARARNRYAWIMRPITINSFARRDRQAGSRDSPRAFVSVENIEGGKNAKHETNFTRLSAITGRLGRMTGYGTPWYYCLVSHVRYI